MFFYSDTEVKGRFGGLDFGRVDPVKGWLKHYECYVELHWIATRSESVVDRWQARKELVICERKMAWWQKKDGWDLRRATEGAMKVKRKWNFEPEDPSYLR